ncbi:Arginase/deacetylase, partial [Pseudovirgaria hyperparasitica]
MSSPSDNYGPSGLRQGQQNNELQRALGRLSIGTAIKTPLPASPRPSPHRRISDRAPSSPGTAQRPPPSPLRRASSTMDASRSSSPALVRKSSTQSLRSEKGPATPVRSSSRRSSTYMLASSPVIVNNPGLGQIEEKEQITATNVATDYFKRELEMLQTDAEQQITKTETVVYLHDQCYGHRFSRPKTPKSTLGLIVERPERILAGALGISAAYVRLGGRHEGGRAAPHPSRELDKNVPFNIVRTQRSVSITSPAVTNVHGTKWMEELKMMCDNAGQKLATTGKELGRIEASGPPAQAPKEKLHEGDLYLCQESLNAFQGALGGVLDGVDAVFDGTKTRRGPSRAFVCIRPPGHHCSADYPSGFCWINNVHVGIQHAAASHGLTHAAIIDFDLHHGDGSQTITWAHNAKVAKMPKNTANSKKTAIGYFSLHDINSYPCEYGEIEKVQNASLCIENAHGQSIWNVHLQPWKREEEFWDLYENRYKILIDKTRAFLRSHTERLKSGVNQPVPKAAIFISAGFDASEWESAGMQRHKVSVPTEFYARFTRDIVQLAQEEGTGAGGRVISVLEGGYSNRALTSGVLSHISGLCEGEAVSIKDEDHEQSRLGYDIGQHMSDMVIDESKTPENRIVKSQYDVSWWSEANMADLELLVDPPPVNAPPKKRTGGPSTFAAPTASFQAKVVDPEKVRRSASGAYRMSASPSRAPTPPPPEVDWAIATHELSKLIIPSNRQTRSCKPEELNEPRVKKEKLIPAPIPTVDTLGRQLRGRKPTKPGRYADPDSDDDVTSTISAIAEADRRKTVGILPSETPRDKGRRTSRRLSVASSIGSINGDHSTRAPSTASTRPTSGPPSRAPSIAAVNVKKRTTAAVKPETASASRPPVPRVAPGHSSKVKVLTSSLPTAAKSSNKENADMEALASGLKKITLKLPSTQEEYEARQREKGAAAAEKEKAKRPVGRPPTKKVNSVKPSAKTITTKKKSPAPPATGPTVTETADATASSAPP